MRGLAFITLVTLAAACGGDDGTYLIVTVDKRPAVNGATTLKVKLTNGGSERAEDLPLGSHGFPATFSVSTPGRTGDLGISVEAIDAQGLLVGRGSTMTTVEVSAATVLVDTADFVINTEFADDQELANFFPAIGYQIAATADGTWTTVHSAACSQPCNVFARRFDTTGKAVNSTLAAGTNTFPVSTRLTTFFATPTVASSATTTLAVWNFQSPPPASPITYSIQCRAFDGQGAAITGEVTLSTDEYPNMVMVTPLPNNDFAVAWEGRVGGVDNIRAGIVKSNCTVAAPGVLTVSTVAGTLGPQYPSSAASTDRIMYAWILDGSVRVRVASLANGFITTDTQIVAKTATETVEHVRVAPLPGGNFAVFVRWANIMGTTGPGRIEMLRTNNAGAPQGAPVVVTTRSGTDFQSSQGFGVAPASDGSIFVVWHACMMNGDDSGCGVFGKLVSSAGALGPEIQLDTTTREDQTGPSAVALPGTPASFVTAWTDRSMQAPDTAGASVRARIVYPSAAGSN